MCAAPDATGTGIACWQAAQIMRCDTCRVAWRLQGWWCFQCLNLYVPFDWGPRGRNDAERIECYRVEAERRSRRSRSPRRFRLRLGVGGAHLEDPDGHSTRIDNETNVGWARRAAASALQYPGDHISLIVSTTPTGSPQMLENDSVLLTTLDGEWLPVLELLVGLKPPPTWYPRGSRRCSCDFISHPGALCCAMCSHGVDFECGMSFCSICGSNGLCRLGECGHKCCEGHCEGRL